MNKVFADTFYWIALTDSMGAAHEHARLIADDIVTTDEVLSEYLTFFCGAPEFIRREIALAVEDILQDSHVTVMPQSGLPFVPASTSTVPVPISATASPTVFPCRPCADKD